MAYFEFPHTRTYDSDLGWLIWAMKKMIEDWENFSNLNSIKFADPILWTIDRNYEPSMIVIDQDGNGYISRTSVPAGVPLSNDAYWTQIFNFGDITNTLRRNIAHDNKNNGTATVALTEGDLVWWNGELYRVIYSIAAGTQLIIDTNIEKYTVDEKINSIAQQVDAQLDAFGEELGGIYGNIAHDNGTTGTATAALAEGGLVWWNAKLYKVLYDIAAGTQLIEGTNIEPYTVDDKIDSVLDGIETHFDAVEYDIQVLQNENAITKTLEDAEPVNVLTLGIKNDGSEDISTIFNEATVHSSLYFPAGTYKVSSPLYAVNNIYGAGYSRQWSDPHITLFASEIDTDQTDLGVLNFSGNSDTSWTCENLTIRCNSTEEGIRISDFIRSNQVFISKVSIINSMSVGIHTNVNYGSRSFYFDNISILYWKEPVNNCGIRFSGSAADSKITNAEIMACRIGIDVGNSYLTLDNIHVYCGHPDATEEWWRTTRGIFAWAGSVCAGFLYIDSAFRMIEAETATCLVEIDTLKMHIDDRTNNLGVRDAVMIYNPSGTVNIKQGIYFAKDTYTALGLKPRDRADMRARLRVEFAEATKTLFNGAVWNNDRHYTLLTNAYGWNEIYRGTVADGCTVLTVSDNQNNATEITIYKTGVQFRRIKGLTPRYTIADGIVHVYLYNGISGANAEYYVSITTMDQNSCYINYDLCRDEAGAELSRLHQNDGTGLTVADFVNPVP